MRRVGFRSVLVWGAALALLGAFGCKKGGGAPAAPVQKGGYLVYDVSVSGPGGNETIELRVSFDDVNADGVSISTAANEAKSSQKLSPSLLPEKGFLEIPMPGAAGGIGAGMLWLPPDQRKQGLITKAGTLDHQQHYANWDVFPAAGRVGNYVGTRYFEVNTGMLVAFTQNSGPIELGGKLKDSK
jgi:hypothetical protein